MTAVTGAYDVVLNALHDLRDWRKGADFAQMLAADGYRPLVVTNARDVAAALRGAGVTDVVNVDEVASSLSVDDLEAEIERLRAAYRIESSFYKLVEVGFLQDRPLYRDRRHAMYQTVRLLKAYERVMASAHAQWFFQPQADDVQRAAFYYAGRRWAARGCALYTHSGLVEREILFVDDNDLRCTQLRARFDAIREADRGVADHVRERILQAKQRGRYLPQRRFTLRDRLRQARQVRERLLRSYPHLLAAKWLQEMAVQRARGRLWRLRYERPRPDESFVFYPMHAPIEGQTIVRGFAYRDEMSLIRAIADSLPPRTRLYVKEHPGYEGARPRAELRELGRLADRVRLIDPQVSSHDLIRAASVSVVVNSSVWFESIILRRPVITLGRGLFTGYGVTREVADLGRLDREIERAMTEPLDEARRDRFLQALWDTCYPGRWRYAQDDRETTAQLYSAFVSYAGLSGARARKGAAV